MKHKQIGQEPAPTLVGLSDELHALANRILRIHEGDHADVDWAREQIENISARLDDLASNADTPRVLGADGHDRTRPYYFPGALAPRVHVNQPWMTGEQDGDRRFGQVRFDLIHEGPPGWAHGGHVAWVFDQAFGQHVVASELGGPTHRLEVVYRRGTPLFRPLDYELRTDRREGRKIFASAELRDGDTILAEARALFVEPKQAFTPGT